MTQLLIEIIFALYLVLAIFDKNYRPRKNWLIFLAGLFLAFLFISSVFGIHFFKSFWGNEERLSAWFYLLHIFAVFLVFISVFKNKKEWNRFLAANVVAGIAMFAIAILSLFGVKFWGVELGTRISGTLGNPLFLGAYFVIILTFALYLGIAAKNFKQKILWFLCSAIIFYGIFLTQNRSTLYGTMGGAMLGLLYYGFFNKRKMARIAVASFMVFIVLVGGCLVVFRKSDFVRKNEVLSRVSDLSFTSGTGNTRLMGWRVALAAIKERPLLGWGMEGFDAAFNKYYNPQFLRYSYYETWFDKPHNKVLEVAVDGGIIALVLYLSIFAAAGREIRKKESGIPMSSPTSHGRLFGEPISSGEAAVLIGGLAAYFAQNLFVFDTSVSYLMFFILLAFINRCEQCEFNANDANGKLSPRISVAPVLLFLGLAFAVGWFTSISPFLAGMKLRSSTSLSELDNTKKVDMNGYKQAMKYFNPYKEEWRVDLAKNIMASLRRGDGLYSEEETNFSIEELKKNLDEYPASAYYHMLLGSFYAELGVKDGKYFDLAKIELGKALELSPLRQHILFNYGRLYGLMKDKENLIKVYKKAIALEPKVAIAYWEAGKQMYLLDQKDPLVLEWWKQMAESGYFPEDNGEFMIVFKEVYDYFLENKNYKILAQLYERMEKMEPEEAKWPAQKATACYFFGDNNCALEEIRRAIELDEGYRVEGEKFIQMIENTK